MAFSFARVEALLETCWKQQHRMCITPHAHAQCYWHISPDGDDEPSRFMRKIVSLLPNPLQLKQICISVTHSSQPPRYLPASHSSILRVHTHSFGVPSFTSSLPLSAFIPGWSVCSLEVYTKKKGEMSFEMRAVSGAGVFLEHYQRDTIQNQYYRITLNCMSLVGGKTGRKRGCGHIIDKVD